MAERDFWGIHPVDVRTIWRNEAEDFTPWLRRNLHLLGNVVGLRLDSEGQSEVNAGQFSLDIMAKEIGNGCRVAIENQLTKSDHLHLGQMLTYGAWLNARTMIWVAVDFNPEHLEAVRLFNIWTRNKVRLFAVKIEVKGSGNSLHVLKFRPVTMSDYQTVGIQSGSGRRPNQQGSIINLPGYSDLVRPDIANRDQVQRPRGFSGIKFLAALDGSSDESWVYIFIHKKNKALSRWIYEKLKEESHRLEEKLETNLIWDSDHGNGWPVISLRKEGGWESDPPKEHEKLNEWLQANLAIIVEVFNPCLERILADLETE